MAGGAGGGGGGGGGGKTSALVDLTGDSDDERSRGSESATLEQAFVRQRVEAHEGAFLSINSVNAQFEELHKTAPSGSRLSRALLRAGQDANVQVEKIVGRQAGCSTRYMNLRLKMTASDADDLLCGSSSISSPQSAGSKRPLDLAHSSADSGASRAIAAPVPKRSSVKPQTSDGEKEPEQPNALKDELASKNRVCALLPLCVRARRGLAQPSCSLLNAYDLLALSLAPRSGALPRLIGTYLLGRSSQRPPTPTERSSRRPRSASSTRKRSTRASRPATRSK